MSQEERERLVREASEAMQEGEDTPWKDRETHRGEEPHMKNAEEMPYIGDNTEHRGKENTPGAFGKQEGTGDAYRPGDDTRDKAIEKLQRAEADE